VDGEHLAGLKRTGLCTMDKSIRRGRTRSRLGGSSNASATAALPYLPDYYSFQSIISLGRVFPTLGDGTSAL
jgi:hypothetical protein